MLRRMMPALAGWLMLATCGSAGAATLLETSEVLAATPEAAAQLPPSYELTLTEEGDYTITLSDVLVSSFSQSSGGEVPAESISLNYTKIEMIYTPYDAKGTKGTPVRAGYDLTTGAKF